MSESFLPITTMQITEREADFLEHAKCTKVEIARVFGIPLHLLRNALPAAKPVLLLANPMRREKAASE